MVGLLALLVLAACGAATTSPADSGSPGVDTGTVSDHPADVVAPDTSTDLGIDVIVPSDDAMMDTSPATDVEAGVACTVPLSLCGTSCTNVQIDPANCGVCGNACATGQNCTTGSCTCPGTLTVCGSGTAAMCRDLASDALNCGACGVACGAGQSCIGGTCYGSACVPMGVTAPPQTYDFVINTLTIDSGVDFNQPHTGYNVDHVYSPPHPVELVPDCDHQDFFSTIDIDQNTGTCMAGETNGGAGCQGGVDNQLPELAQVIAATGTNIGIGLNTEVSTGGLEMLVRLTRVNGTLGPSLSDCDVGVSIFFGHPLASDCSTIFSGASTFAVDNSSLTTPGDLTTSRYAYTGQIINGRLRVADNPVVDNIFPFQLPLIMGVAVRLDVHHFQFRSSVTPTGGNNGNLGGYLLRTETSAAIATALPEYASLIGSVIGGLVDVATGTPLDCGSIPPADGGVNPNGGIGYGIGFTMVGAVISPTAVTGAPAGTCGAP